MTGSPTPEILEDRATGGEDAEHIVTLQTRALDHEILAPHHILEGIEEHWLSRIFAVLLVSGINFFSKIALLRIG